VRFSPAFGNKRLRVMEVSPPLLDTVLREGSVHIKGKQADEAVLCTTDKTYQIRFLEYSNTQLLVDPTASADGSCSVVGQAPGYYELKETRPRTLRVGEILAGHVYTGVEAPSGIPFTELEAAVQASTKEIKTELAHLGALEIEGHWWEMDADYKTDITDSILDLVVEHDWPVASIPCAECVNAVQAVDSNFTRPAALQCLKDLSTSSAESSTQTLDELKVCWFRARQLLQAATSKGQQYDLEEFTEVWKNKVPTGMEPTVEMLKGLALLDAAGPRTTMRMLTTEDLPADPAGRFRKLFAMRPKWTREDLQPYLSGVLEPGQTEDQLLLKHTRVLQACQGRPRLYAPR